MGKLGGFAAVERKQEDLGFAVDGADEGQLAAVGAPGGLAGAFSCGELACRGGAVGGYDVELGDVFIIPFGGFGCGVGFYGGEGVDGFCACFVEVDVVDGFDLEEIGDVDGVFWGLGVEGGSCGDDAGDCGEAGGQG